MSYCVYEFNCLVVAILNKRIITNMYNCWKHWVHWTLWCMYRLSVSSCTRVRNFWKWSGFFGPPCI